jgi:hypothetical protein
VDAVCYQIVGLRAHPTMWRKQIKNFDQASSKFIDDLNAFRRAKCPLE